ncbi:MAG: glycosyltransferase family 2 protein [Planctomycetes bacterium]|nr:glycosyltransferase family 2 protein [Planctomycetota bacterium]
MSGHGAGLSLVVPAYNEAIRIEHTLGELEAWRARGPGVGAELVLVDDGSEDATLPLLRGWAHGRDRVQVLALPHRGKGHAVRAGMLAAQGARVAFADADLATPLDELQRLLAALEAGADVAIGSREGPGAVRENEPGYRHVLGRGFNWLVQALVLPGIADTQCGFKLFRAEAAREVFGRLRRYGAAGPLARGANVTAFDVEVLLVARHLGYTITEVPVRWRHERGSKVRPLLDTARMARSVCELAIRSRLRGGAT